MTLLLVSFDPLIFVWPLYVCIDVLFRPDVYANW